MPAALRTAENDTRQPVTSPGLGRFLQFLSVLQRSKGGAPASGIFALTSAIRGEGVSYVANALGREMAVLPGERVLLARVSVVTGLSPRDLDESNAGLREISPRLWTTLTAPKLVRNGMPELQPEMLHALRRRFTYVLLDCPALQSSPEILRIAPQTDGVVLVVGAGLSRRDQVIHAQKILRLASDNLLGCVLNNQKPAVSSFLDRHIDSPYATEHDSAIS